MKLVYSTNEITYKIEENTFEILDSKHNTICEKKRLINPKITYYIHELISLKFYNIFLFRNPVVNNSTKEWGFFKNSITKSLRICNKENIWVNPRRLNGNVKATIGCCANITIQKNLNKIFSIEFISNHSDGYKLLGIIPNSNTIIYSNRSLETDYIYFFPNTENEVDIVFDVIEKLGFFEGWEKNPDYKKSSQENSTISCEPEGNTDKSIQTEDYVEPDTVEENTIEIEAVEEIELPKENLDFLASEEDDTYEIDYHPEGREKVVMQTVYERNPENRRICIEHYKYNDCDKRIKCQLCGFDFEAVYGDLGRDFIEVHHIIPLSETRREIRVNPIKHLIPVCSNCHRMLHRGNNGNDYSKNLATLQALFPKKNNT